MNLLLFFLVLATATARPRRTVYFAVVVDHFEDAATINGSEANRIVLSRETALELFNKATDADKRQLTVIGGNNIGEEALLRVHDSQTHWRNFTNLVDVVIKPIFVEFGFAVDMYDKIYELMAQENDDGELRAVVEMGICTASKCVQTKELAVKYIPYNAAVFSLCCYDPPSYDDIHVHHLGPKLLYDGLEPHSLVHLTYLLAVRFNWRRFHFVVSPYWPTFDQFFEAFTEGYEEIGAEYADQMPNGDIIYTKSYFCTEYLAKGNLCSDMQAHEIILRQATVTIVLMDIEKDLPYFIRQLKTISSDNLSQGKAVIVANPRGIVRELYDVLKDDAPDGLMMIKTRTVPYDNFKQATVEGFPGMGIDGVAYNQLRMISRAAEIMEQQPGEYKRISNFFCGTNFTFDDSPDYIGYAEHCERDWVTYEIFNVKRDHRGNASLEIAFTVEYRVLFEQSKTPHWIGSGPRVPFEDFCKLDGTGCPPIPIDLVPIVAPAVGGFAFIGLLTGLILGCIKYRRDVRRKEELVFRNMVILNIDDLRWESVREASMRSTEKMGVNPVEKLKKRKIAQSLQRANTGLNDIEISERNDHASVRFNNEAASLSNALRMTANFSESLLLGNEQSQRSNQNQQVAVKPPQSTSNRPHPTLADQEKTKAKSGKIVNDHRALFRNEPVFVKRVKRQFVSVDMKLVRELLEVRNLNHQNINTFFGIIIEPGRISALQQWCAKGTLASLLARENVKLDRIFKISFLNDIANGMAYLHKSNIVSHGALTPDNILIDARWMCKIANIPFPMLSKIDDEDDNLGLEALARILMANGLPGAGGNPSPSGGHSIRQKTPENLPQNAIRRPLTVKTSGPLKKRGPYDFAFTQRVYMDAIAAIEAAFNEEEGFYYTAPELLRIQPEERPARGSQKGDIYSFGLICFYILTKEVPFANCHLPQAILLEKLKKRKPDAVDFRPVAKEAIEDNVEELMEIAKACWEEKPDRRPRFDDICKVMMELNNGNKENNITDQMIKVLEERAEALEENLAIQLDELANEKQQVQELLGKMLPRYVVDEMHAGRYVAPKCFENATVLCSNILGFSELAMNSKPGELVAMLEQFMTLIERVLDGRDIHKIDEIGGRLRIVSGLPKLNGRHHATEIANIALEIMACVHDFKVNFANLSNCSTTTPMIANQQSSLLPLRIGIHTGTLTAGIVGLRVPRYCVFGETLETTANLELLSPAFHIHISAATKSFLDKADRHGPPLFLTSAREQSISVKGLGTSVTTYYLTGKRGFKRELPSGMT